ncbi:MAG: tetratricopeptide repeat protein [Armatimonadota bacterium]|nr:tetratricopeptide repeat protein [Armatimonadota bacterium]MDR7519647.1 tetratricopeptide repeat protein [Armatimonadota bacterium]
MRRSTVTDPRGGVRRAAAAGIAGLLVLALSAPAAHAQGTAAEWPALIRRYEEQVARTPSDPTARFTLAMLYAREGRLLDGYKQLQEADRAAGPARRLPLARQIAREAEDLLSRNAHDLLARYRLAFARHFLGDHAGSAAELERVVAAEPRNDWGYGYLGQAYATLGQLDRAIATWERGLMVNPTNAVLHYMLGLAYSKKDDKKKAAAHLAAAYRDRTLYDYVTGNRR